MLKIKTLALLLFGLFLFFACREDDDVVVPEMIAIDTTRYQLSYGAFPDPQLPADNILTEQGVQLGRMLFYETMLSKDGTQACADCHRQPDGFSDSTRFSLGIAGLNGRRQAMPIFNMAWHSNGFFWDGRAPLVRDQVLLPIQDPLEMNETLDHVMQKLQNSQMYRDQFTRAFGSDEIIPAKMALAMEQFILSVVSHQSKYDQYLAGEVTLTESEERGRVLFVSEYNPFFPELSGADCAHCHGGINFENDQYMNNGLDRDADFTDLGREEVTGNAGDRAKFKVPTLRNIATTAPYMHDGRFKTLEEVVDHYNSGIQESSTTDPTVLNTKATGLLLDEQDKQDLVNFLKTLTDESFLQEEAYRTPF